MKPLIDKALTLWNRISRLRWVHFTLNIFTHFGKDNGGLLAAGLAFFLVLAIVPLLLVGLWALGQFYIDQPDKAVHQIQGLLATQVLPGAANTEVLRFMQQAGIADAQGHAGPNLLRILHEHGFAGLFGLVSLVFAALQIFINGAAAMNAAWEATEKRNWVQLRLVALGLLIATGVLVALSLAATYLSTRISASSWAHLVPFEGKALSGLFELGAVVLSIGMYAVIYKYLPSAKVSWRAALFGAAFAAVAWEVAKKFLALYLLHPNKSLYGELANLIVLVIWILYSMTILLLGAETAAAYAMETGQRATAALRRAATATPSADTASSSSLTRAKDWNRARRVRNKTESRS